MPDQKIIDAASPAETSANVHTCDFRMAARLSNEGARSLMTMHEAFARQLGDALDAFLSKGVELKLKSIDQVVLKEHLKTAPFFIAPLSLSNLSGSSLVQFDDNLALSMLEILMGGTGQIRKDSCELSEIDREVLHDIVELVATECERAWNIPSLVVIPSPSVVAGTVQRFCNPSDKFTLLHFSVKAGGASGACDLLLPPNLVAALLKQTKLERAQQKVRQFPKIPIRERLLECDMEVCAELPGLRVAVRDLIGLQPGSVLKLRAPIQSPGMLTAGGRSIYEALPVRNGSQRAAQLGKRVFQQKPMTGENHG